jgi:hypothetical protein
MAEKEYTVVAPDGKEITLIGPVGASQEQVIEQAKKLYQGGQPVAVASAQPTRQVPEIPQWKSAIVGAGKGIVDPALAIAQYSGGKPAEISQAIQQRMKPFQEANPMTFGAGQIGGGVLTGGALMKGAGMIPSFARANPYLQGAAVGGAAGALTPTDTGVSGMEAIQEIPQKVGLGAVGGAGGTAIGRGIGNVVAPKLSEAAQKLIGEGVNLTPGQMMGGALRKIEDKLTSVPLLGDIIDYSRTKGIEEFNKAAFKRALDPIGGTVPKETGRAGVEAVKTQISDAYNTLLPKMTFVPDKPLYDSLSRLDKVVVGLPKPETKMVADNVKAIIQKHMPENGLISGGSYKAIESDLGELASNYAGSSGTEAMVGKAYKSALGQVREALARSNPNYAEELGNINKAFANFSRIRRAGSMANTQEMITPSQLANAVKAADESAGKGATATGKALMQDLTDAGVQVLPSKIPDSGTAGRSALVNMLLGAGGAVGGSSAYQAFPTVTAVGAGLAGTAALPYLPGARNALTTLVGKRPEAAKKLADAIRELAPYMAAPAAQRTVGE